jgi:hypothetical protein
VHGSRTLERLAHGRTHRSRVSLHLEIIALRHQLTVVNRSRRLRLGLTAVDRMLWSWLSYSWRGRRSAIHIVKPEPVLAWHRRGFRLHELRAVIREMSTEHPLGCAADSRGASKAGPRYLLHDRDSVSADVSTTIAGMNTHAVRAAPRSPWHNPYAERVIGSMQRECLDHVIAVQRHRTPPRANRLRHVLPALANTLSLGKDTPSPRPVSPPSAGRIVAIPQIGGLHHRYDRIAA